jgi:hypothetical protein
LEKSKFGQYIFVQINAFVKSKRCKTSRCKTVDRCIWKVRKRGREKVYINIS